MISVSFFHVFIVNNLRRMPGGEVLARLLGPGGDFELLFCLRVGNSPIKKNCPGALPGGWSGLELTDT